MVDLVADEASVPAQRRCRQVARDLGALVEIALQELGERPPGRSGSDFYVWRQPSIGRQFALPKPTLCSEELSWEIQHFEQILDRYGILVESPLNPPLHVGNIRDTEPTVG